MVGVASTLALGYAIPEIRAESAPILAESVAFAAAGSLIPDIDINGTGKVKKIATTIVTTAILLAIWLYKSKMTAILDKFDIKTLSGIGALIVCLVIGLISHHRTFTHELIGLLAFSAAIYLIFGIRDMMWFSLGMLLHQLLDMLNMQKIKWLWPLKKGVAAGVCKADGLPAEMIGLIATLITGAFIYLYYAKGLIRL